MYVNDKVYYHEIAPLVVIIIPPMRAKKRGMIIDFAKKICPAVLLALTAISSTAAEQPAVVFDRGGSTIALEAYAPNIVRVTLSSIKNSPVSAPGYGFVALPSAQGWTQEKNDDADIYRSPRLMVSVFVNKSQPRSSTQADIAKYFHGSNPPVHITISTAGGKILLDMTNWRMAVPNYKDDDAGLLQNRRPSDQPFYRVGATFRSPDDEHYYGLGQNQEGFLDHRGHPVHCWNNYIATGGPSFCVPFLVTNKGYGMIWDNPSKTTIKPGFNEQTRVEFRSRQTAFRSLSSPAMTPMKSTAGYRLLTGATPMLPKACLRIHPVQAALLHPGRSAGGGRRAIANATCPPT